jgi:hypothetical protein
VEAPGTFSSVILKDSTPTHDDTHFEHDPWFNSVGNFQTVYRLVIIGTEDLIIASLHEMISRAIFTVPIDEIVKDLGFKICEKTDDEVKEATVQVEQNSMGTGMFRPK